MIPTVTLRHALEDEALLGNALVGESWHAWRALLIATMGMALEPEELETFQRVTGRAEPPLERVEEAAVIIGRRGGKNRAAAVLGAYPAAFVD